MRLLVVGHPFLLAHNQKKYAAMKQLNPDLQLRLVVPSKGRDRFELTDYEVHSSLDVNEVKPFRAWFAKSHMTYVHGPLALAQLLRDFRPEIIHIEEEPQALITVETVALQRLLLPETQVTLFTWDNLLRSRAFPIGMAKRTLRKWILSRVAGVVCGNTRAAELLSKEQFFQRQINVVPQYGLDPAQHQPGIEPDLRHALGLADNLVVGFVGRFVPEKGLLLLVRALERLQSYAWKLLLVGSGPLEDELRKIGDGSLRGRVVIVPAVPYEDVPRYLRCADIFVLPSYRTTSWVEQFGLAMAQAMMLGIPCIGASSGAIPEVLGPGGIVFEEKNEEQLVGALEELLTLRDRREEFGRVGRSFALQKYSQEKVAKEYLRIFEGAPSPVACGVTREGMTAADVRESEKRSMVASN